jgi:hypothetical protein
MYNIFVEINLSPVFSVIYKDGVITIC